MYQICHEDSCIHYGGQVLCNIKPMPKMEVKMEVKESFQSTNAAWSQVLISVHIYANICIYNRQPNLYHITATIGRI